MCICLCIFSHKDLRASKQKKKKLIESSLTGLNILASINLGLIFILVQKFPKIYHNLN